MNASKNVKMAIVVGLVTVLTTPAGAALIPNLEWVRTYDSPASNHDMGWGVALDVVGNPFVVGREMRPDLGQDYNIWLRKYDFNGNVLQTNTYDSPNHGDDRGYDVTTDVDGNTYVIGQEMRDDLGQSYNLWLRKYDRDGNTLWTRTYDSPSHHSDSGRGVVVDESGNIYAIGIEERDDLGQDFNIWLGKYDSNGNLLWTRTYDSPAHGEDICWGGAIDSSGNIYVTGHKQRND